MTCCAALWSLQRSSVRKKVNAQYSYGAQSAWNVAPGSYNASGTIEGNKLVLKLRGDRRATYKFLNDDFQTLKGKWERPSRGYEQSTDLFKLGAKN